MVQLPSVTKSNCSNVLISKQLHSLLIVRQLVKSSTESQRKQVLIVVIRFGAKYYVPYLQLESQFDSKRIVCVYECTQFKRHCSDKDTVKIGIVAKSIDTTSENNDEQNMVYYSVFFGFFVAAG